MPGTAFCAGNNMLRMVHVGAWTPCELSTYPYHSLAGALVGLQRFLELTRGYIYPPRMGGQISTVGLVENQMMPTLKQYVDSIPTLLKNGTTRLPKPVGADTKVSAFC